MKNFIKYIIVFVVFFNILAIAGDTYSYPLVSSPPYAVVHYGEKSPASYTPVLRWNKNTKAVYYELEVFTDIPKNLSNNKPNSQHVYFTDKVFLNAFMLPLQDIIHTFPCTIYWRVRAMDIDHNPLTTFSSLEKLYSDGHVPSANAPIPIAQYNTGNGSVLLYPVYEWIPNPGAEKFEIEVLSAAPDTSGEISNSQYKVFSKIINFSCEFYDPVPRIGKFYWRVRALDSDNNPIGVFSTARLIDNDPSKHYIVGIFGDSISHGGGHMSYGPEDFEFSYAHYLDFPTINLSESGDTIEMMVKRFDNDVLPFTPKYLIIMGASNSLRAGIPADKVILGLKILQQKCYDNNIEPILLTLPSINPANIKKVFDEATSDNWADDFNKVNAYIRTQVHIDTAADFPTPPEVLPTCYALDGLHLDDNAKAIMGNRINKAWPRVIKEIDERKNFHIGTAALKKFFQTPDVYDL